jgi:phosphate transport system permease protein
VLTSPDTLIAKRHRAEKRFQRYGQMAIGLALLFLVLLLATIIERGWRGFYQTEIRLTLDLSDGALGHDPKGFRHADVSPYIKKALLKKFPVSGDRRAVRELARMLSSGAVQSVRNALLANPSLVDGSHDFWLPASDAVDRAVKWHQSVKTPENARKVTDRQLQWLGAFTAEGAVRTVMSPYFFRSGDSREPELAGLAASMVGSILTLLSCMLLAFPVGIMAAIYLEEFAPRTTLIEWIEISVNNLAAVPSVVFGLLGLAVYLNLMGIPRSGALAGGLTLALMILPTIIITTRASLRAIPDSIRDAARGLGASPLQVVLHHTVPLAIPGIMTGTILGLARAMGETAPLLMIGMVAFVADIPRTPLDPATSMPVQIYLWATSPEQSFAEKTAAGIIVLLLAIILMNSLAIFIRKRFEHRW